MHFAKTRPCEPYSFIIAHGKGMLFRVYPTTDPGEDTEDMVFALSIEEAEKLFSSDDKRLSKATEYAKERGGHANHDDMCWWRLRTPGKDVDYSTYIDTDGSVCYGGSNVNANNECVRPAIWISFKS